MGPATGRCPTLFGALLAAAMLAAPLAADFESKEMGDDVFFVAFERSAFMSGGIFDSDKVARKKLASHTRKLCREEGYRFVRYVTVREMRDDDELRAAWREATGEEPSADTSLSRWERVGARTTGHGRRCLVVFSKTGKDGYEKCH